MKYQSVPITCVQAHTFIFPRQPSPVLVSPPTVKAVRELLGASKRSSDLCVGFATTGLCEWDSRSTKKPFCGSEKDLGTAVAGTSCEDTVTFLPTLALCSCSGWQRLPGPA